MGNRCSNRSGKRTLFAARGENSDRGILEMLLMLNFKNRWIVFRIVWHRRGNLLAALRTPSCVEGNVHSLRMSEVKTADEEP